MTRVPERIPLLLDKLRDLWKLYPDLRFGQIYESISHEILISRSEDSFYTEDEIILNYIKDLIEKAKNVQTIQ